VSHTLNLFALRYRGWTIFRGPQRVVMPPDFRRSAVPSLPLVVCVSPRCVEDTSGSTTDPQQTLRRPFYHEWRDGESAPRPAIPGTFPSPR
jgi:hypothetical protein